jgi:hypothetical protein
MDYYGISAWKIANTCRTWCALNNLLYVVYFSSRWTNQVWSLSSQTPPISAELYNICNSARLRFPALTHGKHCDRGVAPFLFFEATGTTVSMTVAWRSNHKVLLVASSREFNLSWGSCHVDHLFHKTTIFDPLPGHLSIHASISICPLTLRMPNCVRTRACLLGRIQDPKFPNTPIFEFTVNFFCATVQHGQITG